MRNRHHRAPAAGLSFGPSQAPAGGLGVGLWAGLTKFDDAINSDRKVWTSAIVGAAIGGVGGYLSGRSRVPLAIQPFGKGSFGSPTSLIRRPGP